jgi:hypothetical protein
MVYKMEVIKHGKPSLICKCIRAFAAALVIVCVVSTFFSLTSCSSKKKEDENYIRKIEEETGFDIPVGSTIEFEDDYGWFGDGETFAKVIFPAGTVMDLNGVLQSNGLWKQLPIPSMISIRIFGGEYSGKHYSYGNDNMKPARKVEDGIYYFRDRAKSDAGEPFLERSSHNFTFALYDIKNNILYYFKYDS